MRRLENGVVHPVPERLDPVLAVVIAGDARLDTSL
jgi:hypothetical protein